MVSVGNNHKLKEWLLLEMAKREGSQADLARYASLNRAVINKLVNGQSVPRYGTLDAIACAFKIPIETVYRTAGLLPEIPEKDSFIEKITYFARQIRSPHRKVTALVLIKALVTEEEQEQAKK